MDARQAQQGPWEQFGRMAGWSEGAVGVLLSAPVGGLAVGCLGFGLRIIFQRRDCCCEGWAELGPLVWAVNGFYLGAAAMLLGGLAWLWWSQRRGAMLLALLLVLGGGLAWLAQDLRRYEPWSLRTLDRHLGIKLGWR
jgi:hypothetical protein